MPAFPNIKDADFQAKIAKKFSHLKILSYQKFDEICNPKTYKHQNPQLFVGEFISPDTDYKSLLIVHKIGAGKTCASIQIAEAWKHDRKILYVCPASLVGNVYKELYTRCSDDEYMTDVDRSGLNGPRRDIILAKANTKIDKYYRIISYNKFLTLIQDNDISLKKTVLIMDEVQNIVSESGTMYKAISSFIDKAPDDLRIVIMSATPVFDKPVELALTINLLRPSTPLPTGKEFNDEFIEMTEMGIRLKNQEKLQNLMRGYISYYEGAPSYTFPKKILNIVECKMHDLQYKNYLAVDENRRVKHSHDILSLSNNFMIGARTISNIAFPNGLIEEDGEKSFTNDALGSKLNRYSVKFRMILDNILIAKGPVFIYSNFLRYGGILMFVKVLEHYGYKNVLADGPGPKRYGIWSGDESMIDREYMKNIYNDPKNIKGSMMQIILGTPSIKEGVSLLRVRQVHIMEPHWNMSRLEQVIGRAFRYCAHKDLPERDRVIDVFIYIAIAPQKSKYVTVDEHMWYIAEEKNKIVSQLNTLIQEVAVDRYLFQLR